MRVSLCLHAARHTAAASFIIALAVAACGLSTAPAARAAGGVRFAAPVSYPSGGEGNQVDLADTNRDGALDAIISDYFNPTDVRVLLRNGRGRFGRPPVVTSWGPPGLDQGHRVVADINRDGVPDLVMAVNDFEFDYVYPLLGLGDGHFAVAPAIPLTQQAGGLAAADLNGDGVPDLVVGGVFGQLQWAFGTGSGTFAPLRSRSYPGGLDQIAVADFNGDGHPDLLFNDGQISVILGPRAGTFKRSFVPTSVFNADDTAVGDFNEDGLPDVVAVDHDIEGVNLLLANASRSVFASPDFFPAGGEAFQVKVGDFNGDGHLDVAALLPDDGAFTIMLGDGHGNLGAPQLFTVGGSPDDFAVGDVNGDGMPDIVVVDGGQLEVLLNRTYPAG
jgi:hypothetical protein